MEGFSNILHSIIVLGMAMGIGYLSIKTGYITEETKNALSKVIVKITLPILVVTSLTKVELDNAKIINSIILVGIALCSIGVMYFIGNRTAKAFQMTKGQGVVHECMTAFGNVVFLGYPLIQALYGPEGIFYAALFAFSNDVFVWTLAVYKLSSIESRVKKSMRENLKNLVNPATIAFGVSFIMMIFRWKFTGALGEVFSGIGGTTTYLSMLFIGGTLATVNLKNIYKRVSVYVIVLVKMILAPIILIYVLKLFNIDNLVKSILIIQIAMPSQTLIAILSTEYGGDIKYAAEGIFITTIASLVTLPMIYYLMSVL